MTNKPGALKTNALIYLFVVLKEKKRALAFHCSSIIVLYLIYGALVFF
jgi:hypothetical protein